MKPKRNVKELAGAAKTIRRGSVLTEAQAVEIYKHKLRIQGQGGAGGAKLRGKSNGISQLFNISFKTVKDIWCHKTWKRATHHLWIPNSAERDHDCEVRTLVESEVPTWKSVSGLLGDTSFYRPIGYLLEPPSMFHSSVF
jgi:hypothetical protein